MSWFDEDDTMQDCKVCYACLCSLCSSCAVSTGEGELCPECHSDMHFFLADAGVSDAPEMPHDGQEQLPRPA